ncbi:MAG: sigma-70 family RNA polymerase sigma factor, partial [Verrucomicrobiaceae bacterium]
MRESGQTDAELLAEWIDLRREAAFRMLVTRYAGLVHSAARRTSGDESVASETSQLVFILLARKAGSLASRTSLAGWLHLTAVMQAKNLMRSNRRETRKRQNLFAAMQPEPQPPSRDAWKEMQPVLDEALAALSEKDREALLLRFYRSLSIREIARMLGIATDAAQKRVDRATERLRGKLARRGCHAGAALSAAMLAGFATDVQAAAPSVSLLTSQALAASAATTSKTLLPTLLLMKTATLVSPAMALVIAGAWIG